MQPLQRKSFHTTNKIYFFTATIHKWLPLLKQENNQQLIITYLKKTLRRRFFNGVWVCINAKPHTHHLAAKQIKW